MDVFASYISIDTLTAEVLRGEPRDVPPAPGRELAVPAAPPADNIEAEPGGAPGAPACGSRVDEEWSENFARTLQEQHARVRRFLQGHAERWRQMVAHFTRQIEKLQTALAELTADNDELREQAATAAQSAPRGDMEDVSGPGLRTVELQRQMRSASAALARIGQSALPADGNDWESQKRRLLAELEPDDAIDLESSGGSASRSRMQIEEIIARTDRIIAEKDREIDELKRLLDSQSGSVGSLAVGAAALEHVFDQDEVIREERQRLQQAQEELRAKLRQSEIDHAMERARLARREAEIEERLRSGEQGRAAADADTEALAPTGRPVRGRWRTQMGLDKDK